MLPADSRVSELLTHVAQRLRSQGARMTGPREVVLRVLAANPEHLSAEQVHEQVTALDPTVHLSSVHRTLDMLCSLGVAQAVHLGHGATLFHLVEDDRHCHAQCRGCGQVVDLPASLLTPVADALSAASGFVLDAHDVALSGRCRRCAAS